MSLPRSITLLISVIVVAVSPRAGAASLFLTPRTYPSGEGLVAVAVQDFNNDGVADIVSANVIDKSVSVFINNGDGTFAPANNFDVGVGAIEVASGDLDGDGNADLVVTDASTSAHVALGHGDGTFGTFSTITLHSQPKGIAIADLNADGIPDLAIAIFGPAHTFAGEVAILIGHGDGSFAAPIFYQLGNQSGNRVVATDLNNDGKLDLTVAIQHGSRPANGLAVLLGNGDGTFQSAVTSVAGVNASDVAAADFNGDGKMDLALTSEIGVVEVVLGNGDGTFQSPTAFSTGGLANGGSSNTVTVADVNRDGLADLVVGSFYAAILLGDGSGGFGPPALYRIGESFARVGYFNHDRVLDIVGGGVPSKIAVAFGRADGNFNAPRAFPGSQLEPIEGFDSADFDGDGHPDVVSGDSQLYFVHGLGDGTFSDPVLFATLPAEKTLIAADFNGDGKEDVLALPFAGSLIYTVLGNGDGTFQPPLGIGISVSSSFINAAVGDFNRDGKTDLALTDFTTDSLFILLGKGDGTFQPAITYQTLDGPQAPHTADFNLDGIPDLVVSTNRTNIYLGVGDGTFQAPLTVIGSGLADIADFNRDGKPDLVLTGADTSVVLGNGDGTFQLPQTVFAGFGFLKVGDLDQDGRPDLMIELSETTLVALRGQGDGTFRPPVEYLTGSFPTVSAFLLQDLNGDGAPEVVMGNVGTLLTVLLNGSQHR